mmetsp:Transcript_62301/g.196739  ORF Transcript_62301/g.196739 Transcript_62301/m.196739 type:complete len:318 (+) Transcript_62301:1093-2046(+)
MSPLDAGPEGEGQDLGCADQHHERRPHDLPRRQRAQLGHDLPLVEALQVPGEDGAIVARREEGCPTCVVRVVLHAHLAHLGGVLQVQQQGLPPRHDQEVRRLGRLQQQVAVRGHALQVPHRAGEVATDLDGKACALGLVHIKSCHGLLPLPVHAQGWDAGRGVLGEAGPCVLPLLAVVEPAVAVDPDSTLVEAPHCHVLAALDEEEAAAVWPVRDRKALEVDGVHGDGVHLPRLPAEVRSLPVNVQPHQLRALHAPHVNALGGASRKAGLAAAAVVPNMLHLQHLLVVLQPPALQLDKLPQEQHLLTLDAARVALQS